MGPHHDHMCPLCGFTFVCFETHRYNLELEVNCGECEEPNAEA
jgi:hypothetical protein